MKIATTLRGTVGRALSYAHLLGLPGRKKPAGAARQPRRPGAMPFTQAMASGTALRIGAHPIQRAGASRADRSTPAQQERARCKAIIERGRQLDRMLYAATLAFDQDLTAAQSIGLLEVAALDERSAVPTLAERMAGLSIPNPGPDGGEPPPAAGTSEGAAARILAAAERLRQSNEQAATEHVQFLRSRGYATPHDQSLNGVSGNDNDKHS